MLKTALALPFVGRFGRHRGELSFPAGPWYPD
jgi:hypothetical protein